MPDIDIEEVFEAGAFAPLPAVIEEGITDFKLKEGAALHSMPGVGESEEGIKDFTEAWASRDEVEEMWKEGLRDRLFQRKLNSMTKYPPIPTFHEMNPSNGMLDGSKPLDFGGQAVNVTEKINGTNGRIIVLPDGRFVIGSREELLSCSEDWIRSPELGIVDELWDTAVRISSDSATPSASAVRVFFFEVYGGGLDGWKNYTQSSDSRGHRLFDVIEIDVAAFRHLMSMGVEQISSWRQHGGQPFVDWDRFLEITQGLDVQRVPVIERIAMTTDIAFDGLQNTLTTLETWFPDGTLAWLESGAQNRPEGVVFKSRDRRITAKLRFQDYKGTLARLKREEGKR